MTEDRTKAPPGCKVSVIKVPGHPYGWEATLSRPFPNLPLQSHNARSPEEACRSVVAEAWNQIDEERKLAETAEKFNP